MIQEFKKAMSQIQISDTVRSKTLELYKEQDKKYLLFKRISVKRKLQTVFTAFIMILLPTIAVVSAVNNDVYGYFSMLFGKETEIIHNNMAEPTYSVLNDTMDKIDIDIKGITGDSQAMFLILELTRTDGEIIRTGNYKFAKSSIILKDLANQENNPIISNDGELVLDKTMHSEYIKWDYIKVLPDSNPNDNVIQLCYIAEIKTNIGDTQQFIPGETYILQIENIYGPDFFKGYYISEFTANYDPTNVIHNDINKELAFPLLNTDDEYGTNGTELLKSVDLTPVALRYDFEITMNSINNIDPAWGKIYIELDDGTIYGTSTYEEYLYQNQNNIYFLRGGLNGKGFWIFDTPIDINKVKAIQIGNLRIELK